MNNNFKELIRVFLKSKAFLMLIIILLIANGFLNFRDKNNLFIENQELNKQIIKLNKKTDLLNQYTSKLEKKNLEQSKTISSLKRKLNAKQKNIAF